MDTQWLNSLLHDPNPIEYGGYNAALARVEYSSKAATTYMFCPLIDAPPSHPDTVLTTLSYLEITLTALGTNTSNTSADMQLYIVATLIKWASHGNLFKSVMFRPGRMHTLMSFNGCIGNLIKASGLEILVGAAFSGLTSIMTGKAWVILMRAFRMVTAALLYDFIKDGPKTFEDISQYLDTASDLANSMKDRLGQCQPTDVLVIFDHDDDRSAKDHERIRRAGEEAVNYNNTTSSKLPCRDAIMRSKPNKKALVRVLSTFNLGNNVTMVGREESMYSHDEADITIISYILEAVKNGKNIVRVISDDIDVFVLLIF